MRTALDADSAQSMIVCEKPTASDGADVWGLIKDTGVLDLNSAYSYIMLCDYFAETVVVARNVNETSKQSVVGFVSAYIPSDRPDTLFVWQIAVQTSYRGYGLGTKMLMELLSREYSRDIRYIEATISPSNEASRRLFTRIADRLNTDIHSSAGYPREWFPGGDHEEELLYRIGPFTDMNS